jgi:hypothetical protein
MFASRPTSLLPPSLGRLRHHSPSSCLGCVGSHIPSRCWVEGRFGKERPSARPGAGAVVAAWPMGCWLFSEPAQLGSGAVTIGASRAGGLNCRPGSVSMCEATNWPGDWAGWAVVSPATVVSSSTDSRDHSARSHAVDFCGFGNLLAPSSHGTVQMWLGHVPVAYSRVEPQFRREKRGTASKQGPQTVAKACGAVVANQ